MNSYTPTLDKVKKKQKLKNNSLLKIKEDVLKMNIDDKNITVSYLDTVAHYFDMNLTFLFSFYNEESSTYKCIFTDTYKIHYIGINETEHFTHSMLFNRIESYSVIYKTNSYVFKTHEYGGSTRTINVFGKENYFKFLEFLSTHVEFNH